MHFTALQVKTSYSILNSLNDIKKLVLKAVDYGYDSLAITDINNMFGVMEFYLECKKNNIKPIIGLDLEVDDIHLLLYAKNLSGYKNLIKLTTITSDRSLNLSDLEKYKDNLILVMPYKMFDDKIFSIYDDKFIGYTDTSDLEKIKDLKVFINDVSYLNSPDYKYLDYAKMIKNGKVIGEYELNRDIGKHLLTKEEFNEMVDNDTLQNIDYIVNNCNVELKYTEGLLPVYDESINSRDFLHDLSYKGLDRRLNGNITDEYKKRLDYELDVINKMGFNDYFLIVYDYVLYAKKHNILVGPGRGSAAGSLVSYTLGITDIDPIKYNLLFERFLNIERVTMPDIDIDFDALKRSDVIEYVINKYGIKNVAGITTFGTFGIKMAIRDMGRVMNVPLYVIDDLCKKIGNLNVEDIENNSELVKYLKSDNKLKKLFSVCKRIEGLPRHTSIHAAGVIMSSTTLDDIIPLNLDNGKYLSCYEAMYLEELGLLKMDFLGLKNLSIIDNILNSIKEKEKINLKFNDIPLSDDKTNEIFQKGDTSGIFQFESSGMQNFLVRLHPDSFTDVYNANAFFRPGPSSSIDSFIRRKFGKEKIDYFDNSLENILKETKGIIVYQEQIMNIANIMASFTLGEADILRRAMSKKKLSDITKYQDKFINQSISNGYSKDKASEIFNLILNFASYGFNKSHSVAYSIISYKMAYLKAHYPLYFYLALLNSSEMDEVKTKKYIQELKAHNLKVNKPDINISLANYTIHYNTIYLPFNTVKGISSVITNKIINAREDKFNDIYDFFVKMTKESIPKNVYISLITSGTLDTFNINRKTIYDNLDNLINYGNLVKDLGDNNVLKPEIIPSEEFSKEELINYEKECFGFYLSNHPVVYYRNKISNTMKLVDIKKYFNKNITCILLVDRVKEVNTKDNLKMAFLTCSDEETTVDVIIFPKVYETIEELKKSDIIKVEGKVERKKDYNIIASSITNVKEIL